MAGIAGPMLPEIASKIPFPIDFSVIFSFAAETGSLSVLSKSPSSHSSLYTSFTSGPITICTCPPALTTPKHLVPLLFFHDLQCFHPLD